VGWCGGGSSGGRRGSIAVDTPNKTLSAITHQQDRCVALWLAGVLSRVGIAFESPDVLQFDIFQSSNVSACVAAVTRIGLCAVRLSALRGAGIGLARADVEPSFLSSESFTLDPGQTHGQREPVLRFHAVLIIHPLSIHYLRPILATLTACNQYPQYNTVHPIHPQHPTQHPPSSIPQCQTSTKSAPTDPPVTSIPSLPPSTYAPTYHTANTIPPTPQASRSTKPS
jgi:hypothetical protein